MGEPRPIATYRKGQIVPHWLCRCVWARRTLHPYSNIVFGEGVRQPPKHNRRFNGRRGQHLMTFGGNSEVYRSPTGYLVVPMEGETWECAIWLKGSDGVWVSDPPSLWRGDRENALADLMRGTQ